MRIYIGGIGGVGKTTLAQAFVKAHLQFTHLSGSEVMMSACHVNTRENLSRLDPTFKLVIENTVYVDIVMRFPFLIMDGHCRLTTKQANCFDKFVYLTASSETIKTRRQNRGRRDTQQIDRELAEYNRRAQALVSQHNIDLYILQNEGSVTESVRVLEYLAIKDAPLVSLTQRPLLLR